MVGSDRGALAGHDVVRVRVMFASDAVTCGRLSCAAARVRLLLATGGSACCRVPLTAEGVARVRVPFASDRVTRVGLPSTTDGVARIRVLFAAG